MDSNVCSSSPPPPPRRCPPILFYHHSSQEAQTPLSLNEFPNEQHRSPCFQTTGRPVQAKKDASHYEKIRMRIAVYPTTPNIHDRTKIRKYSRPEEIAFADASCQASNPTQIMTQMCMAVRMRPRLSHQVVDMTTIGFTPIYPCFHACHVIRKSGCAET
jgi:hypothetical protein